MDASIPRPHRERWQPLRIGLVDLFYYDIEEFHFHDGRLLLRGNNGTGKSKVLALTLPFLLDGDLSAHRVEPDGDRKKRMEWNLLLGGRHPHPERLGYTWLEFGRLDASGTAEYCTVGAGLKAVAGRGIARHWFFVTSQRIGPELSLVGPTRVALSREKLKDAVDGHGTVFDTATDYRRAVDETLFGLGAHRYEALVNLLIQLRQPQLTKKPDEKLLSRALTEALPPLDPALLSTVADAFRGLDEERETLRGLAEARVAADAFLGHYRRYARVAAKRQTTPLRQAHSRYEQIGRELGDADSAYDAATAALAGAQRKLAELAQEKVRLEARRTALQQSPEMRDAEALKTAGQEAQRLVDFARSRQDDRKTAQDEVRRWEAQVVRVRQAAETEAAALRTAQDVAQEAAVAAIIADSHAAVMEVLVTDQPPYQAAARAGAALIERQTLAVSQLEELLAAAAIAEGVLREARGAVDRITGEQQTCADQITKAETLVVERAAALVSEYSQYLDGAGHVAVDDADGVLAALEVWVETLHGPNPALAAVAEAVRRGTADLARREAELNAELASATAERDAALEEIARLEAGGHDAPPRPYLRDPQARDGRPGAPFWKVVDFSTEVPPEQRAGLEAALEAAAILDAWISPEGELYDAESGDVVVRPGAAAPAGGLTAVLAPAIDRADPQAAALTDEAITAVLGAIGLGDTDAASWVDVDGRFSVGVLTGSWRKQSAAYIGEGARETARRARLSGLRAELAWIDGRLAELAGAAAELAALQTALAEKVRAQPSDNDLREAHVRLSAEHEAKRRIDDRLTEAMSLATRREGEARSAHGKAVEFAGDVRLPVEPRLLVTVRGAVGDYRAAVASLWPAARALDRARQDVAGAEAEIELATERYEKALEAAGRAATEADTAAERHRVLLETAGAGVEELYRRLDAVAADLTARDEQERSARASEQQAVEDRGRADGRRETLREAIVSTASERDNGIAALRAFTATGLLAVALPDLDVLDPAADWPPTPAVTFARTVNSRLEEVDDADRPWELVQQRVSAEHKVLTDALSREGHSVGMTIRDGTIVVDVLFQGRKQDIPTLVGGLASEIEQRTALLSAKEREILENHLINEVAGTLQELITGAEEQVRAINDDLAERPTSTGMRLRLDWRVARDAPAGLNRVRDRLLRQTADAWSMDDRTAVGAFLQEQINREHADDTTGGGWAEQLTRALDYRGWHEFAIERHQDGQWRPASGPASGGERVLAASIPLFAAASSFYTSSGNPHAPRMIALDEAFAGVDDDSRAKCLGLLAAFDLDVVMTSEREWGCYPQVPGLAIAQLTRRDGIDAVLVTPWRWNGIERESVPRPAPYLPQRPGPDLPADEDVLFG
ncbi:MAG: hypothetical protein QOG10_2308 [Kribbellaceae bacterium]|nr:hypothetical protein [Kribbellaceae bacterium]